MLNSVYSLYLCLKFIILSIVFDQREEAFKKIKLSRFKILIILIVLLTEGIEGGTVYLSVF